MGWQSAQVNLPPFCLSRWPLSVNPVTSWGKVLSSSEVSAPSAPRWSGWQSAHGAERIVASVPCNPFLPAICAPTPVWQARHLSAMVWELHGAVWQALQRSPSCAWLATPPRVAVLAWALSPPGLKSAGPTTTVTATTTTTSAAAAAIPMGEKKPGLVRIFTSSPSP